MARALHVCFLSQEYPPETGWGGIGAYTYEMAHGLARAGQQVTVISLAEGPETVTRQDGVEVHRVARRPNWARWKGLWWVNRIWPGFASAAARRLREVHSQWPVDVVEAAECRGDSLFVPMLRRRPRLVVRLHTAWIFVDRLNHILPDFRKRLIYRQEAVAIRSADMVTAPSQAVVDLTPHLGQPGRPAGACGPEPGERRRLLPWPGRGGVGGAGDRQAGGAQGGGPLGGVLPGVLRRCPRSSFRFVGGDGVDSAGRSWRERLVEGVAAAERGRVQFEQVPRSELIQRYRGASLCVLPSVWENFPYALLEAMACGVPVVGTCTGGLPELIEDRVSGLVVPKGDPGALTDGICTLLEDDALRKHMGREARRRVEGRYSIERVVPAMLETYRAVLDGGRS